MSKANLYNRLHRIFSSTHKTQNPKNPVFTQNPQKSTQIYTIKDLLHEQNPQNLVQKFNFLSQSRSFRYKHKLYESTIHRLALANRFSLIEETLNLQKKYVSVEHEGFAARLIFLYGKSGMFHHAHQLFDELPQLNCERTVKSFNSLLGAAVNSKNFDKACEIFKEIPLKLLIKPDLHSYNTVAYAFCEMGLLDDAVLIVDEMKEVGIDPDVVTFNTILDGFCAKKGFCEGEKIWDRMVKSNVEPNVRSFNVRMKGMINEGKVSGAVELVEEVKNRGLKPDVGSFNVLIDGFCREGDLDRARVWYGELLSHGCHPNRGTFRILGPFLCEKGDSRLAFEICSKVLNRPWQLDEACLQHVVDALVKGSMIEEAKELVERGRSGVYFQYVLNMPEDK